jgi:hypothetical protein
LYFSLAAAALIATAVLWITDDYYTTLFASHPDHRPMFPHSLAWSFPYVFLFVAVITGAALWRLILVSPPPFTGRQYPLLAVEISVVGIAFQPLNWMIRNLDLSSQSPHSDLAGVLMWRAIWLAIWALLFGVFFFVFCYQRLTSQSASPTPRL